MILLIHMCCMKVHPIHMCTTKPIFSSIIFMRNKNHGLRMHSQRLCLIRPRTYRNKACVRIFKFSNKFFDMSGSWDLKSSFKYIPNSQFFCLLFFKNTKVFYSLVAVTWIPLLISNRSRVKTVDFRLKKWRISVSST